ncbi:MAG: hypothetical protein Q7U91_00655 [Sideroxyarcus sp.]|nr:hypothetical protein [Sideroxyarcus sp.]
MNQSNNEMSSFLAELAGEATQKMEANRTRQQDRQAMTHSVNAALERTFKFFNLFAQHLNALEPDVPRVYALDGKTQFSRLKWKSGMAEYRKQSIADNALMNHVYFQVRLTAPEPVTVTRRFEQFDEIKKDLDAYGLKPKEDMHDLWRNRAQKAIFQVELEPEFIVWMRFLGNYTDGSIELESNNLDGFGVMKGKLNPELLQTPMLDGIGKFLMGRTNALPQELELVRDFSRNR